jgi:hypothetical protein
LPLPERAGTRARRGTTPGGWAKFRGAVARAGRDGVGASLQAQAAEGSHYFYTRGLIGRPDNSMLQMEQLLHLCNICGTIVI